MRRLLDIVACTTAFGGKPVPAGSSSSSSASDVPTAASPPHHPPPAAVAAAASDAATPGSLAGSAPAEPQADAESNTGTGEKAGGVLGLGSGSGLLGKSTKGCSKRAGEPRTVEATQAGADSSDGKECASLAGNEPSWKEDSLVTVGSDGKPRFKGRREAAEAMAAAAAAAETGDTSGMCPSDPQLGDFYDFIAAGHLTPPIQGRWREGGREGDAR